MPTYPHQDYSNTSFREVRHEDYLFSNCNFTDADFTKAQFIDCRFEDCILTGVNVDRLSLQDVTFKDCQMIGWRFDHCDPFLLSFVCEGCMMTAASFYQMNLQKCELTDCDLTDADFAEADLSGLHVGESIFSGATFDRTNLEKADFRQARDYRIDPQNNRVKGAFFAWPAAGGLLSVFGVIIS